MSCAIPWCHTGYISRYIRIRVSWILHQDTSGNIRIHRDTKSRYMYLGRDTCGIQSELLTSNVSREVLYVTEMQDTCNIHSGYIRDTCICRGDQDTCGIHLKIVDHSPSGSSGRATLKRQLIVHVRASRRGPDLLSGPAEGRYSLPYRMIFTVPLPLRVGSAAGKHETACPLTLSL